MYLDYFSLKKFPFRITPDPSLFFPGGADGRGVVLDALIYAITSGEGILKVVGEVGSGKTMLCRMLGGRLSDSVEIVYLANPNLSARDIIFAIAFELELDVDSNTDRLLAMHKLQDYLLKKHSEGGTVVVFIEEAQSMPLEALEEIRLLSNLETHQHKLMQIVLFGQPELDKKLQKKSIRQLRERITHSFNLEPLSVNSTQDYLRFRLQAAGCPWPQLFSPQAEKKLAKAASGLNRRINILADKALMSAYADSSSRKEPRNSAGEIQSMVLPRHVTAAIRDSGYGNNYADLLRYSVIGLASLGIVGALVSYVVKSDIFSTPTIETPTIETPTIETPLIEAPLVVEQQTASAQTLLLTPAVDEPETQNVDVVDESVSTTTTATIIDTPETISQELEVSIENEVATNVDNVELFNEEEVIDEAVFDVIETPNIDAVLVESVDVVAVQESTEALEEALPVEVEIQEPVNSPVVIEAREFQEEEVGLVASRTQATEQWLQNVPLNSTYTLQLISISKTNRSSLEEFLQFFSVVDLMDQTYVCPISATAQGPEQWLVLHGEFAGVTAARNYIEELPAHLRRYSPYIRNTNGVACKFE